MEQQVSHNIIKVYMKNHKYPLEDKKNDSTFSINVSSSKQFLDNNLAEQN
jgi:hypothetical protein